MAFTMGPTISFSVALLATTAFLLSSAAPINPFCKSADDKVLCTQLVKNANDWPTAMTNALNAVLLKAKAGKPIADTVGSKLPSSLLPQSKQSIDSTCHEMYGTMVDNLQQCLGFVKKDPDSSLKTYLSATSFSDCVDGLEEFGVDLPEVDQFSSEMLKLSSTLLAVADEKK